jgi:hypothetical protein
MTSGQRCGIGLRSLLLLMVAERDSTSRVAEEMTVARPYIISFYRGRGAVVSRYMTRIWQSQILDGSWLPLLLLSRQERAL